MDNNQILEATIKVFAECGVKSFPIDCIALLKYYGYRIFTYDELLNRNEELYEMCMCCSEDAFRDGNSRIIAYNANNPKGRVRFSLMHELGHHVMQHTGESERNEQEANAFASYILAPRMSIHYSKCRSFEDVSYIFDVSSEAAAYAFDDYCRWYKRVLTYKMTYLDKAMYGQFYNKDMNCFIWNVKECDFCGKTLYNSHFDHCDSCCVPEIEQKHFYVYEPPMHNIDMNLFRYYENKWLYDNC